MDHTIKHTFLTIGEALTGMGLMHGVSFANVETGVKIVIDIVIGAFTLYMINKTHKPKHKPLEKDMD